MRKTLARTTAATAIALGALTAGAGVASADLVTPPEVPSNPTGADYVNAWNESGTHLGAGAAGLISSAWAGAIPSILGA
ncbi:hypothetical protein LY13_003726 [Prauserella aidingensis]|uniref:hypothetical protein n=1 Tax=Prauserella aidingensis TaxID=387890 RepID=UPI0020A4D688|nr:hypothetical protein [Prauserella aidingensis]MCP2254954.1 hypothetical protein [Prauserella aidingensis]